MGELKDIAMRTVLLAGIALFVIFAIIDFSRGSYYFAIDSGTFIILMLVLYKFRSALSLTSNLFALIFIGFVLHMLGVFGFYGISPIGVLWDAVTHLYALFVLAIIFFNMLSQYMDKRFTMKTVTLVAIAFIAALGVGSLIENVEFAGFVALGFWEAGLGFGEGDAFPGQEISDSIETYIGGFYNTMWDLIHNLIGAAAGVILSFLVWFFRQRRNNKKKA